MEHYRTSAHTRFDLKYHFVWITKYRKAILGGQVGLRLRELVVEVCKANDVEILQGHISKDHVHVFVSVPPQLAPSKLMQYIKGKTSRKLMMEFKHIQKAFWGRHLGERVLVAPGNVTDEVIRSHPASGQIGP
jgi:putative transposase